MPLSDNGKNSMVNGLASNATHMSLHSADPGTTGANEITGGSPAYARKAATWGAASAGVRTLSSQLVFDVPAGVTVTHTGVWSAASGGTFQGGDNLRDGSNNPVSEAFSGQGTYTVTTATLNAVSQS